MVSRSNPVAAEAPHAGPQSVGRVIAVLEHLAARRDGATLAELAHTTGAPKTSLVGLLQALLHERCLRRESSGRYVLGDRIYALAMLSSVGLELNTLARPFLQDLVDAIGETAILGVLATDADQAVYIDKVEGTHPLRYTVPVGERRELHCTAMGLALLAHAEPDRIARFLRAKSFKRFTPHTLTTARALGEELQRIRERGIARSNSHRIEGVAAVAAPVFDASGRAVGALLVAGPTDRFSVRQADIERQVMDRAAALSRLLGANTPPVALPSTIQNKTRGTRARASL
jgi:IclR family transcriptional regulator, acetate operon repressor